MTRIHPLRNVLAILAVALATAAAASLLPDNPYQRWQLLDGTIHRHARWIYERIHFDPSPVDVVFVGPSRIARGVDPIRMEGELRRRGYPVNVVNFALPEGGRNLNTVIVEELLKTKRPELIVIGVIEKPARLGHPAFKYLAPPGILLDPAHPGNARYLSDLAYLPFRQLTLFAARIAPWASDLSPTFDPNQYTPEQGVSDVYRTMDGRLESTSRQATMEELEEGARAFRNGVTPPILPRSLADVEFGDERESIRRIVAAARRHGVKVAFLSQPYWSGPTTIQEETFYRAFGPVWNAGFLSRRDDLYADSGHMTRTGADVLTDWIAPYVAAELRVPQEARK
jgi:hypothetical protein